MVTKQAVILVGGKGTRLGALAAATPKPLMAIDEDMVFLDLLLFEIARHGFQDILLLAGHLADKIAQRYDGRSIHGAAVRVIVESVPAGTAGALKNAEPLLDPIFLLVNGDTLFDVNLRRLTALIESDPNLMGALALRRTSNASRYGSVVTENGYVVAFHEKQCGAGAALINGGVGVFRREILGCVGEWPSSMELNVYPRLAKARTLAGAEFEGYFIDIGTPDSLFEARRDLSARRRPAVFFDRDGVLNRDFGYSHRAEEFDWIPGAIEAIRCVNDSGGLVIVVTNQSGVGRGLFRIEDVQRFHTAMSEQLAAAGAHIDAFYFCPYHPEAIDIEWRHPDHPDRKPNPGMILQALEDWPIDVAMSFLVGDKESDVEAARRGGIRGLLFPGGDLYESIRPEIERVAERHARAKS
ncbi:histidinol phosphate phosphatase [Methylosinus sp. R-45379]|uniref:HAD-IIIA family hydrolase n=1 Tax=unclassified Methylosinus TaxID=2624500 RepID=UPI0004BA94E7|nr:MULTISPECIES: HAD-IIIA family hydrolase [unclassified Methylosinus]OAI25617.1 histidinol phosphate phosphatase [Methylosinus sp. R-45379]